MFIVLSPYSSDKKKYYNTDYIKAFEKRETQNGSRTLLDLTYGNDIVKETPEEIFEMIRSDKND